MMKKFTMRILFLPIVLLISFFSKVMGSSEIDGLGKMFGPHYPTFHTSGYTFNKNSETGFIPALKAFAKEQHEKKKDNEPVCIVIDKEIIQGNQPLLSMNGKNIPFKNLILKLEDLENAMSYKSLNGGYVNFNNFVHSIQFIGFEHFTKIGFYFCMDNPHLETVDISSFTALKEINGMFCINSPIKTIFVAGEAQKEIVEDYFKDNVNPPQVIIKTHDDHFLEEQMQSDHKKDANL